MEHVKGLLKKHELDDETCDYLCAAIQDADGEDWKEIAEAFLTPEALDALLALVPATTKKPSLDRGISNVPELPSFAKPSDAGILGADSASGTESSQNESKPTKGKKTVKLSRKAKERQQKNAATKPSDAPVVEITSRVSRYHKELVEDEITTSVSEVDIHEMTMVVAGVTLLEDAHLKLMPGQRYGFIGRNGCGKTTLLQAMVDKRIPGYPARCATLLVAQEDVGDERTPIDTVLSADAEYTALAVEERTLLPSVDGTEKGATQAIRAFRLLQAREALRRAAAFESKSSGQRGREARKLLLEAEAKEREAVAACQKEGVDPDAQLEASELLADVRERLRTLDVGSLKARAEALLKGLGFSDDDLKGTTARLSGGWRMRIALAKALFAKPDVLLLDEPTNHLDWTATLWLEKYLQTADIDSVALVVVSHDRAFLDNVCTMILRVHDKKLHLHDGNYSAFEDSHEKEQQGKAELATKVAEKRAIVEKQMKDMEKRGRDTNNEKLLKQVASRKTKLGQQGYCGAYNRVGLEGAGGHKFKLSYGTDRNAEAAMATESKEADVKLRIKSAPALGNESAMLQCKEVVVGYDSKKPLVAKFDLDVRMGSRIALLGINGSGKTSVLRVLTQDLEPLKGEVYKQPRVLVGFFNQHQADGLPLDISAVDVLKDRFPEAQEGEIRGHLGSFGMGRQAVQPISTLSGGEKVRIALASITFRPPHILLLDEPTNHLDLQTVEALGKALQEFQGGLVIASHDRRLLKEVCDNFYGVQDRRLQKTTLECFVKAVRSGATKAK